METKLEAAELRRQAVAEYQQKVQEELAKKAEEQRLLEEEEAKKKEEEENLEKEGARAKKKSFVP